MWMPLIFRWGKEIHPTLGHKIGVRIGVPRLWMFRMLTEYAKAGITGGPVFRRHQTRKNDKVERAHVGDINLLLHPLLLRLQETDSGIIGHDVKVEDKYSVSSCSLRRGATTQARNMEIPTDVIEANNRWKQKERARGSTPHMSLLERYTDAQASVPLLVRFSSGL
jgi:hypothetical protein